MESAATTGREFVALEPVHFATVPTPYGYVFPAAGRASLRWAAGVRAGADAIPGPCLWFTIHHPEHGLTVVDTGLHPDALVSIGDDYGTVLGRVFSALEPVGGAFDAQLRERGIEPDEVERVLMTHLHVDHTSGMRLLPAARFVSTREEWAAAHRRGATIKGYASDHLPEAERMEFLDVSSGEPWGPFAHSLDYFGDGSVRLLWTPGHTAGHMSLLLRTGADSEVLVVGDAAYALRSIDEQILPLITEDAGQARDTLRQLREYRQANPGAIVVPSHDPGAWRQLPGV